MNPYYQDEHVILYYGDCREILGTFDTTADCIIADPPYGETSLAWDRWPDRWVTVAAEITQSMWCFGSLRMFLERRNDFAYWSLSQEIVWEKHNGATFHADRFRKVHEHVLHWYRGEWNTIYHKVPTTADATKRTTRRKERPTHTGEIANSTHTSEDGGPRLMRSVIQVRSTHGHALHPTQKPIGILAPLIEYSCPPGGTVLDPFAGSGSTGVAAVMTGRRAVLIEADERYCEVAARRLAQRVMIP